MYPSYQGTHRTLGDDDRAAMVALYPASGGAVPAPVDPLPLSSSTLAVEVTAGWNLRVLPAGPLAPTIEALPCVTAVYAWTSGSGWAAWVDGAAPVLNSLTQAAAGTAYWIEAEGPARRGSTTFS